MLDSNAISVSVERLDWKFKPKNAVMQLYRI